MAVPAHLWLYDASGALICGGSEVAGREGSIEVQRALHDGYKPYVILSY